MLFCIQFDADMNSMTDDQKHDFSTLFTIVQHSVPLFFELSFLRVCVTSSDSFDHHFNFSDFKCGA